MSKMFILPPEFFPVFAFSFIVFCCSHVELIVRVVELSVFRSIQHDASFKI